MFKAGIDVGSTTVKGVLLNDNNEIVFKNYERHEARQVNKVLSLLSEFEKIAKKDFQLFMTGSGGKDIADALGVKFVQEVNAVSLAVETFHPDVNSVAELGGQDAKMILWINSAGKRRKVSSMNDKCAGGTGATIDRIISKLNLPMDVATTVSFDPNKVHPVAAKCGVFAETDINSLQKAGVPSDELLISLFNAIVIQNLTILTRGYTLRPKVLLLGGPNTFFPALVQAWQYHLNQDWKKKDIDFNEESVVLPSDSLYYAALGSSLFGNYEESKYRGKDELISTFRRSTAVLKKKTGELGLLRENEDLQEFREKYAVKPFKSKSFKKGETVDAFLGVDAGSTSTKAVLVSDSGEPLAASYRLSKGNPLEDTKKVVSDLRRQVEGSGAYLNVLSVGVTGYAKDMLKQTLSADVSVVETVAHTISAKRFFDDIDVLVDVGGQDIKVMFMSNGEVEDFRLNTQCSAGNGYFLQSTAEKFGYRVEEFADIAFKAKYAPRFSPGCAVFLEQDIVNFQRIGWQPEEIMAGLAKVLPRNIWLYVVKEPNLKKFGRRFLLQGGTQRNLAAVKAQYDFIRSRVPDADVLVHPIAGEAGAYGAAIEAQRRFSGKSSFIGLDALENLEFSIKRDETTRCHFCPNRCLRTFIYVKAGNVTKKYIIAPCEKGSAADISKVKEIVKRINESKKKNPNLQGVAARDVFKSYPVNKVYRSKAFGIFPRKAIEKRKNLRVGIPRVLNLYSLAPFFRGYLESLGVKRFVFSDYTSEKLIREGLKGGAIDPCFPSKIALAHVNNLIEKKPNVILFPRILTLIPFLSDSEGSYACPTAAGTPMAVKAVLTKEEDVFKKNNIEYLSPILHFHDRELLDYEMFMAFKDVLDVNRGESRDAVNEGLRALNEYQNGLRLLGKNVLDRVSAEGRMAVLLLGRPYHNDPGVNHGILEELQKCGYPILTIESLPVDRKYLRRVFGNRDPFSIRDVWKKAYSENTNRKVWGMVYAANHPNIAVLDLSSFRCGHDAPIYSLIESIARQSNTPYFTFHEIDENKPTGSIRIRVETIDYFLKERIEKACSKPSMAT